MKSGKKFIHFEQKDYLHEKSENYRKNIRKDVLFLGL